MEASISHHWQDETIEAKTVWFRTLPLEERMDMLCMFTDLIVSVNPKIVEQRHAQSLTGRIQVFSSSMT